MLVIASLFPELGNFTDLSQAIHLTPKTKASDSVAIKVAKLGLAVEEHLLANSCDRTLLLWSQYDLINIDKIISSMFSFRRDQIVLPTLDMQQTIGWVAGHSVALIRLAAVCPEIDTMDWTLWPTYLENKRDTTSYITWWAQRINLRIYEATL
jgi:hypothetical protein